MSDQCANCGAGIRPTGKFHKCQNCGLEICRAKLTDTWKVSRLSGQGGPGRGQGRKPVSPDLKKEQSKARISAWVLAWLDEHKAEGSRGELLEAALIKVHKLKPPTAG